MIDLLCRQPTDRGDRLVPIFFALSDRLLAGKQLVLAISHSLLARSKRG